MTDAFYLVLVVFAIVSCFFIGFCTGYVKQGIAFEEALVRKDICEYRVNSKTGKTTLVIIASGKPFREGSE